MQRVRLEAPEIERIAGGEPNLRPSRRQRYEGLFELVGGGAFTALAAALAVWPAAVLFGGLALAGLLEWLDSFSYGWANEYGFRLKRFGLYEVRIPWSALDRLRVGCELALLSGPRHRVLLTTQMKGVSQLLELARRNGVAPPG